jgi:hypothetical protein
MPASRISLRSPSKSVRPSRAAATVAMPMAVSLQGSCATASHTKSALAAANKRRRREQRFMIAAGCRLSLQ